MILKTALEARLAGLCLLTCLAVLILGLLILESLTGLMILVLCLLILCGLAILVLCLLVLCRLAILVLCLLVPGCLLVLPVITALSLCACGCLPLDCECYMLGKCWTGAYCRYFREAVLPLDPALEAALTTVGPRPDFKPCPICGGAVAPDRRQAYCSEACALKAHRRQQREYMRRKRG